MGGAVDSENVDGARAMDSVATRLVAQHKMLESVCHTMGTMLSVVRSWRVMVGPGSGCDK